MCSLMRLYMIKGCIYNVKLLEEPGLSNPSQQKSKNKKDSLETINSSSLPS
jgi:hypothetical protein